MKYDPESRKHVALTQRLALFVGANNVPLHLVDNEEFRELLTEFDPQYQIPCRQKLKEKVSITSIVITYVRHQITALQYSIKGGAQGTRWQPSFGITRWPRKWQHVSSVSSSVSSRNRLK